MMNQGHNRIFSVFPNYLTLSFPLCSSSVVISIHYYADGCLILNMDGKNKSWIHVVARPSFGIVLMSKRTQTL